MDIETEKECECNEFDHEAFKWFDQMIPRALAMESELNFAREAVIQEIALRLLAYSEVPEMDKESSPHPEPEAYYREWAQGVADRLVKMVLDLRVAYKTRGRPAMRLAAIEKLAETPRVY
jgi:hypothetical protein